MAGGLKISALRRTPEREAVRRLTPFCTTTTSRRKWLATIMVLALACPLSVSQALAQTAPPTTQHPQAEPSYTLDPTSTQVVKISGLASTGAGTGCSYRSTSGRVVARTFDKDEAITLVGFTIEDETGARTFITVDTTSLANSGMATRGWIIRGLQTLLREGNEVTLELALCGAAGRVALLETASRVPLAGNGEGQRNYTEDAKPPRAGSGSTPAEGAAQSDCDLLAANPTDAQRYPGVPGVQFKELHENLDAAIKACTAAVDAHPGELRFKYQLARALQYRDKKAAAAIFQQLVVAHYAAAFDNLGWIYISDSKDYSRAIQLFQAGYALGDADCAASLFTMIDENRLSVPNPDQMRLQLLEKAAAANHAGALAALPIERARQGIVGNAAKAPPSLNDQPPVPAAPQSPKQVKVDVCAKVPFDSSYGKYDAFVDTIGKKVFLTKDKIDYFLSQVCRAKHGELDRSAMIQVGLTDQQIDAEDDSIDLAATFMVKLHHILQ